MVNGTTLEQKNGALQCITKITFSNLLRKFGREVLITPDLEWSQIVQLAKGQLISKCLFDAVVWTRKQ